MDIWNMAILIKIYVIYPNELKIIAITHFLATLVILDTKITITHNRCNPKNSYIRLID